MNSSQINLIEHRVVKKFGTQNVKNKNIPEKFGRFLVDFIHTLVDARWRYLIIFVIVGFFGSWTFFACFYWIIAWSHGDLNFDNETGVRLGEGQEPCIMEARTFAGFFLLSVESQISTGFVEEKLRKISS